jgi:hypothetical protein
MKAVVLAVLIASLISAFLDPSFGPSVASIPTFAGFLVGLTIVLIAFELPPMLVRWRTNGEVGRLRVLPWTLVLAAVFVLISRIANLEPGYLYGIVLGVAYTREVSPAAEGRESAIGMVATLVVAIAAWLVLGAIRAAGLPAGDPVAAFVETATVAVVVAGLEAVAFGMLPIRFMPGRAIYTWNRFVWAALFGLGLFAFIQILIGPTSGYLSDLSPSAWLAAMGVFAVFGAFSLAFWGWFRFRAGPQPVTATDTPASTRSQLDAG